MKKKYLMKGMAALALLAGFSSCVKDVDGSSSGINEEQKAKENAELQLGFMIPEGQTWNMSTQVTANVKIDLNPSETYTVGICDKNPLNYEDAKFYVLMETTDGRISTSFTAPNAVSEYYVVAYNSKYQAIVNKVEAVNGIISADISYTSNANGTKRSANRATAHGITFPDAPAATDYKTTYPSGTPYLETYKAGGVYYADERNNGQQIQLNGGWDNDTQKNYNGGPLYIVSSSGKKVTIAPSYFYFDARCEGGAYLYICPNVTFKLKESDAKNLQAGLKIYIAEGAKLESEGALTLNTAEIYNAGTITVPGDLTLNASNTDPNARAVLYNQGTINVSGYLSPQNGQCYVVNEGTINANRFGSEGSGTLWNVSGGEIEITKSTVVNSNSNGWVNDGHYTTETFLYNAGSVNVYNNCMLTVTKEFEMNLGDSPTSAFYNEGSIVCEKDFLLSGPGRIIMSSNAVVQVDGTATMNICNPRKYGIFGPESGNYAVFKANDVVKGSDNQGLVSYGGNLAVVCNSHFAQGYKGQYPIIAGSGEDGSGPTDVTIYQGGEMPDIPKINPTPCNPGFEPTPGTGNFVNEPSVYTFAFEDQKISGDYDLNDVVLKITPHVVKSGNKITAIDYDNLDIKLVAAGATFDITVMVDATALSFNGKTEVHDAFGVNRGVMVNTGGTAKNGVQQTSAPVSCTIATPAAMKTTDADGKTALDFKKLNIWIDVNPGKASAAQIYYLKEKKEPYAVMIPNDWAWPTERTNVITAYPKFKNWATSTATPRADSDWYNIDNAVSGKVMTNN